MAYVAYNCTDHFRKFRPVYGYAEQDKEKVPDFEAITKHRQRFHMSRMTTTEMHYKKASSENGIFMNKFSKTWNLEENSMLYTVTEKRGNVVIASPVCAEIGLFQGFEHLQRVSINCASLDSNHLTPVDDEGHPFSFAHQLYFGDLIVVQDLAFYKPSTITTQKPVCTATKYYTLERDIEYTMCMAVKDGNNYHIFKGVGDQSYPACILTKEKLLSKLDPESVPNGAPLPDIFLLQASIYLPNKKCYRLGHCFNRNCRDRPLVKEVLEEVTKLSSNHISNYLPFTPHAQILSGSYVGLLDSFLLSSDPDEVLIGIKSLRAAKLQSSASLVVDRRYSHFATFGTSSSPNGGLYVKMKSKAAISFRAFRCGSLVEIECGWDRPLIATIVHLESVNRVKEMTVLFNPTCGFAEADYLFDDNMVSFESEWKEICERLRRSCIQIGARSFDTSSAYDLLMSSESKYRSTALGRMMVQGMGTAARLLNNNQRNLGFDNDKLYEKSGVLTNTLTKEQILCLQDALGCAPNAEQLHIFSKFLDRSIPVHSIESPFGTGKTLTAVACAFGRVSLDRDSRVALLAQTNAAVDAFLKTSRLGDNFNPDWYYFKKIRPLVVQAKNWRTKQGTGTHPFDHKVVMHKVFAWELRNTDPRTAYGPSRSNILSMYLAIKHSEHVHVEDILPDWKIRIIRSFKEPAFSGIQVYRMFLDLYKPNIIYGTLDMFVAYASSDYLPLKYFPDLVVVDESTMVQPSDLAIFASKLDKDSCEPRIQYFLFGDQKQLAPFNTIKSLAPIVHSPNKLLLNMYAAAEAKSDPNIEQLMPSKLTTVYRCHPAATDILSSLLYSGGLKPGRSLKEEYIQERLPRQLFPGGRNKAYGIISNNYPSKRVVQSRSNRAEALDILNYLEKILDCGIKPSQITVITPYSAQEDLLRQILPRGVKVTTSRKFQGGECDIVLFSATASGIKSLAKGPTGTDELEIVEDESRVHVHTSGCIEKVHLISDPSILLVSMSRARHFTMIFGNTPFLLSIPVWKKFLELAQLI